jgi:hypothetical protein
MRGLKMNGNNCSNMMSNYGNKGYDFQQQARTPAQMPAVQNQHQLMPVDHGVAGAALPSVVTAPTTYNQWPMTPPATSEMTSPPSMGSTMPPALAPMGSTATPILPPLRSTTPTTLESTYYIAGLLTSYVGSEVRVEFLIGTNAPLIDLTGTLRQVGANYIIIQPVLADDLVVCDMFSIKFVTIYR